MIAVPWVRQATYLHYNHRLLDWLVEHVIIISRITILCPRFLISFKILNDVVLSGDAIYRKIWLLSPRKSSGWSSSYVTFFPLILKRPNGIQDSIVRSFGHQFAISH